MINGYVLVKLLEEDEKADNGMTLPMSKGERTEAVAIKAEVVRVGKAEEYDSVTFPEEGKTIYCSKWDVHSLRIGSEKFGAIRAKDIMFVMQ